MKFPGTLTNLGFITAIKYDSNDGQIVAFKFPKTGRNRMILACSPNGRTLYGMRTRASESTQLRFHSRTFSDASMKYEQWSGYEVDSYQKCKISEKAMYTFGNIIEISYISDKWVSKYREYFHTFEHRTSIKMDNDDDPGLICIQSRNLRVTERGIEG